MPLKYLNPETPLINCEIKLILTWSANCVVTNTAANKETTFAITDTKLYVPVETISTQDNVKLLQQLKSGSKRIVNWNKYQSKVTIQAQNRYLVKSDIRTYDNVRKIATGQGGDYATSSLLDYPYLKNNYKGGATMLFITEEAKETILDFSQRTVKVLQFFFFFFCFDMK